MRKVLKLRVLPLFLAMVLFSSTVFIVPASAAAFELTPDTGSRAQWDGRFLTTQTLTSAEVLQAVCSALGYGLDTDPQTLMWAIFNSAIEVCGGTGSMTIDDLETVCRHYNDLFDKKITQGLGAFGSYVQQLGNRTIAGMLGLQGIHFRLERSTTSSGLIRIIEDGVTGYYVVNSSGAYPYCDFSEDGKVEGSNQWIGEITAEDRVKSGTVNLHDLASLNAICNALKEYGISVQLSTIRGSDGNTKYYVIKHMRTVYADSEGRPFVAQYNSDEWASNQNRPDTSVKDENGNPATDDEGNVIQDTVTDNSTNIDLSGMTITLPDGKVMIADQIIYDESTKTYTIDSHDTYNTYNYYYYEWNYYINYTSITYIGQTEEYNKYYEVYYELPDGRDSADLTAEELEQLNLSIDVIPYDRSADDVSLRSLYHFDGDTRDSSYWNYCTDFTWNQGASLTYMDAGVFEGALYLDETDHDFTLTLPSNITAGDFTLQFRYYQSYTAAPQTDSYLSFGSTQLLKFTGSQFLNKNGTSIASTPIGTWNELALIRDSGTVYYYLNGVLIAALTDTTAFGKEITFHFGSGQQTYKYFDELRFLNYALVTGGSSYEPTSVPYDTNLALVLPGSSIPVADEYWSFTSSGTNLFRYDVSTGVDPGFISHSSTAGTSSSMTIASHFDAGGSPAYPFWGYNPSYTTLAYYDGYTSLTCSRDIFSADDAVPLTLSINSTYVYSYFRGRGLVTKLWYYGLALNGVPSSGYESAQYLANGDYVLSVVLGDGTVCSFPFTVDYPSLTSSSSATFDWGTLGVYSFCNRTIVDSRNRTATYDGQCYLYIMPHAGTPVDIRHIELIKGTETDLNAEYVSSVTVFDKDSLGTPTLAVRTDIDITSYQIGGVRPSLPTKGQVWAMVEGGFITSIQIYNGSAWEACDGRIWTGERWIPASSYNVITLQDMYDVVDATQNYEYIYSESGFWSWWQKSWNAFVEKLFSVLGSGGSGSSGSIAPGSVQEAVSNALSSLIEGIFSLITEVLKSLINGAFDLLSGIFSFLSSTVLGGISDFFSSLGELIDPFGSTVVGEDGTETTVTGLPEGISAVFAFFSAVIMLLPVELRSILFFGIGLMLLLSVLKLVKE